MSAPVIYSIQPLSPAAHLYEVSCTVTDPAADGQRFTLPTWIPGSYLIREFARNVVEIQAVNLGQPVALTKLDKCTWQAAPVKGPLTVICHIFAWDLSVRGAHLDNTHGFFNGTGVFLLPEGQEQSPCQLQLLPPAGPAFADWQVATSLSPLAGDGGAAPWGYGMYYAENYAALVDQPVEMGTFQRVEFLVRGVPHALVVTGAGAFDQVRLVRDLQAICEWQMALFGPPDLASSYLFLVMAVGAGYGGLEHRDATALICDRTDLPPPGLADEACPEGYLRFLGLCSHEYFHRWHVKRIRPAAFVHPDLSRESYTRLLWLFEGFTSYYDDLCLVRSGVIPPARYLELLGKTISQVQKGPGRLVQSLEDASFDAWIKYYRPDENSPNGGVSYYAKGALVALCLDLALRCKGASLDLLMRRLWQDWGVPGRGLAEGEVFVLVSELGSKALGRWLQGVVSQPGELPLGEYLQSFGVVLEWGAESALPWLGVKLGVEGPEARLAHVYSGGPGEQAGLAPGDQLVALNACRISRGNLDVLLGGLKAGETVRLDYFRLDLLRQCRLTLVEAPRDKAVLTLAPGHRQIRRQAWLGS